MHISEQEKVKVYVLVNRETNATAECTERYLLSWLARGFEVEEIIYKGALI